MIKASLLACVIVFMSLNLFAQISDFNDADFEKADSVAALYPHHPLTDLRSLSQRLTEPLKREEEKFRAIYKWVCDNIDNDYSLFSEHKRQRETLDEKSFAIWNRKFSARAFRILVGEHRTICTGYARLVSELAGYAGMECRVVDGYGRSGQTNNGGQGVVNHSWNAVKLNRKWYLCDPTWSSGVIDGKTMNFIPKFDDVYFLPPPDMFVQNHFPVDTTNIFSKKIKTLDSYLNRPLVSIDAYRYEVKPILPAAFLVIARKGDSVRFEFSVSKNVNVDQMRFYIGEKVAPERFDFRSSDDDNVSCFLSHWFKSRGTYQVRVVADRKPLITYEVTVK